MRHAALFLPISIVLVFALSAPASARGPIANPDQYPASRSHAARIIDAVVAEGETQNATLTVAMTGAVIAPLQSAPRYSAMHRVAITKPRTLTPPQPIAAVKTDATDATDATGKTGKTVKISKLVPTRAVIKIKQIARPKPRSKPRRARARLVAAVNLSTQRMSVKIDGVTKGVWKISSGKAGFITPRGTYTPYRMHTMWRSRKYNNAKMPHSVFYSGGFAVHATYATRRLGAPASHGCVRLSPRNARKFFNLVKKYGRNATRISITGTTPRARTYARRSRNARRRRARASDYTSYRPSNYRTSARARRFYAQRRAYAPRPQSKGFFATLFD